MSSTQIMTSQFWNDPANDFLRANTEFVGTYVDEFLSNSVLSRLFDLEDNSVINPHFTSFEANGTIGIVPEGSNVPNFEMGKGYKTIFNSHKHATKIEITYEMKESINDPERDADKVLNRASSVILAAFKKEFEHRALAYFNNAFSATFDPNTEQTFVAPDAQPLISATHTYNTGGGFSNLLTASAPTTAVLDQLYQLAADTLGADGKPMLLMPKYALVRQGSAAEREFKKLLGYDKGSNNGQYQTTSVSGVNIYEGSELGLISTPYLGTPAVNGGKAYFFLSDFNEGVLPNPLKWNFKQRPGVYGEFRDMDNLSTVQDFVSYSSEGIAYLPLGIWGVPGTY
jgi:formylmethanofuran dehydrogenase subunit D